jgi:hypothetical protein
MTNKKVNNIDSSYDSRTIKPDVLREVEQIQKPPASSYDEPDLALPIRDASAVEVESKPTSISVLAFDHTLADEPAAEEKQTRGQCYKTFTANIN